MEPIRVLNAVGRMDRGGIETFIMNVYRKIDKERVQFDFLAHYGKADADYNSEIEALGGRIYEMPAIKTTTRTRPWKYLEYRQALKAFFTNHPEYRVLHGHMTNTAPIYMPIARRFGSVTCAIAHSHLTESRGGVTGLMTDLMRPAVRGSATDYFACSKMAAAWLFNESDIVSGSVDIVPNAIDSALFAYDHARRDATRRALGIQDQFVVGHIGRFFPQKNHEFLIHVFHSLKALHPDSVLLLVGEGSLQAKVRALTVELGLAKDVIFAGLRSDVSNLLQAMDAFVLPSHFEGLPVVGVEAQASGLPCFLSENITKEVDLTGNVTFLPLQGGETMWAQTILSAREAFVRHDTRDDIRRAGYDVEEVARWLQQYYIQKHG